MTASKKHQVTRRNFIKVSVTTGIGVSALSVGGCINTAQYSAPLTRAFGKFDFKVTTLGLG